MTNKKNKLTITISSRALFDLRDSHKVFLSEGLDAYHKHQTNREDDILNPGVGFSLIEKFLGLKTTDTDVEVILISKNSADSGLRIFNSIEHYGLDITRACFTSGQDTHPYALAFESDLFLSSNSTEVRKTLDNGLAAATIVDSDIPYDNTNQLKIAFDGDAVIFSDEAEKIYQNNGLDAFVKNEKDLSNVILTDGPFRKFLHIIEKIQSSFPLEDNPIRTALVTARSAPSHKRVIHTMRSWGIRVDESFFLGGLDKGKFLGTFGADIFFDDNKGNCESSQKYVPTGHVPFGINR